MKIKQKPEDFIVIEKSHLIVKEDPNWQNIEKFKHMGIEVDLSKGENDYSYYVLEKKLLSTFQAIKLVANAFRLSKYRIGFAGEKDKKALTYQFISIKDGPAKDYKGQNFSVYYLGKGNKPIRMAELEGNFFEIRVYSQNPPKGYTIFPNYYDVQRFGDKRLINHLIGREILKGNCEEAVKILLTYTGKESKKATKFRLFLQENWGNFKEALRLIPKALDVEKAVLQFLIKKQDYCRALKKLHPRIRGLFIHAYQSYVFNETLKELIKRKLDDFVTIKDLLEFYFTDREIIDYIPIVGADIKLEGEVGEIIKEILEKDGIELEAFKNNPIYKESGTKRKAFVKAENFSYKKESSSWLVRFYLPRGSYATVALRSIFLEPIEF